MDSQAIINIVISVFPSVLAIVTCLGSVLGLVRQFVQLKKTVVDLKCVEDLRKDMQAVINENYELKKTVNELLTKQDHVKRD